MRLLLIDNSNTRTKFATGEAEGLASSQVRVPTADLTPERIRNTLDRFDYEAAVISSVVPATAARLVEELTGVPLHQVSHRSRMPITIDYPAPEEIGADRLANAVAAQHLVGAPSIVIDFGTAVTFDVLGPSGAYLGGVIAPGLASMTEYLHRETALLPAIDLAEPRVAIGQSTVEAMRAGAVYGYRGMVREILIAIQRELSTTPRILATGGDAGLIANGLPEVGEVVPELTLLGIRLIGEANL